MNYKKQKKLTIKDKEKLSKRMQQDEIQLFLCLKVL